jgi:hypothetical protein
MEEKTPTMVTVRLGTTLNLGNFQNVKIEFEVQDHVRPVDSSTSAAIDRVYALVDKKLEEKALEYKND